MLHLICSNVREHQKGKFIVLVTERDIVGASCYLKMINKNSYWFCKVNKSSCSNDSISQWKGLVELVWHSADPPQTAQLSQTVGLSLSAGAFEPNTEWPVLCTENTVVPPPTCWRRFGLGWMDGNNTGAAQRRCDSLNKPLEATCEQVDVKGTKFYSHCFFSWVLCFQWSAWKYSWALQASAWEFSFWGQPLQVLRENCPLPATELWEKQLQGWVFVNYSFSPSE